MFLGQNLWGENYEKSIHPQWLDCFSNWPLQKDVELSTAPKVAILLSSLLE